MLSNVTGEMAPMKFEEIERLAKMMCRCGIESLELERGEWRLRLGRNSAAPKDPCNQEEPLRRISEESAADADVEVVANDQPCQVIRSPMIGSFYRSPSPGQPAFVEVGSSVTVDSVVCIIEAMKVLNEITADLVGTVVEVLVQDGQAVEFGQPLFKVAAKN